MQLYKYETHAHTREVSKCSSIGATELVYFYKDLGYTGICITDHFLNGNTTVPPDIPWEEQVELFCRGFEQAQYVGKQVDLDVFFGWEYSYKGMDLLTYGLDRAWLLNHPEVMKLDVNAYCDLVHAHGGFIVHAHPFREASYISMIRLLPRKVDAVEVINACRTDFENQLAAQYADHYGLLKMAGSDNHIGKIPWMAGIQVKRRLSNVHEFMQAIARKEIENFMVEQ